MIRNPRLRRRGRIVRHIVQAIDVMPTVLELLGLPIPASAQGRSLGPLPRTGRDDGRDHIAVSVSVGERAIRTPTWKLIEVTGGPKELYQIRNDPGELHNVIDRYPEVAVKRHAQLEARLPASETAPVPVENPVQWMQGHGYW